MRRHQWFRQSPLLVVVVAAGSLNLACGGGTSGSVVGPTLVGTDAVALEQGTVSSSGQTQQSLCHVNAAEGAKTLSLPPSAVAMHLAQHTRDYKGACGAPAATCPCFTRADIDLALSAPTCYGSWSCDPIFDQYWMPGIVQAPAECYFYEAGKRVGVDAWYCRGPAGTQDISAGQFEACKSIIAPAVCPVWP